MAYAGEQLVEGPAALMSWAGGIKVIDYNDWWP